MGQVIRPGIPYLGPIPSGLSESKKIIIKGHVPDEADLFQLNLLTALDPHSDRALHLSVQFNGHVVVRNASSQGLYGYEEREGFFPFNRGQNFTMLIEVDRAAYKITLNGEHYWNFSHRMPFSKVSSIFIDGDVEIEKIEYLNKIPPVQRPDICTTPVYPLTPVYPEGNREYPTSIMPCTFPIYGGLRPGMMIFISGRPSDNSHKFTINLQSGSTQNPPQDIAFHFDVRFFNYTVVRNSRMNNTWSSEETTIPHFPFIPGVHFDMFIQVQGDKYMVTVNGEHFISFRHRLTNLSRFRTLCTENDVIVTSIRYT